MPPRKVLIAFHPGLLDRLDLTAEREHRTRSDLIREAVRDYLHNADIKYRQQCDAQIAQGIIRLESPANYPSQVVQPMS